VLLMVNETEMIFGALRSDPGAIAGPIGTTLTCGRGSIDS
jgi:hypothetical protein